MADREKRRKKVNNIEFFIINVRMRGNETPMTCDASGKRRRDANPLIYTSFAKLVFFVNLTKQNT